MQGLRLLWNLQRAPPPSAHILPPHPPVATVPLAWLATSSRAGYSTDGTDKGDLPMAPNDLGEYVVL